MLLEVLNGVCCWCYTADSLFPAETRDEHLISRHPNARLGGGRVVLSRAFISIWTAGGYLDFRVFIAEIVVVSRLLYALLACARIWCFYLFEFRSTTLGDCMNDGQSLPRKVPLDGKNVVPANLSHESNEACELLRLRIGLFVWFSNLPPLQIAVNANRNGTTHVLVLSNTYLNSMTFALCWQLISEFF